MPSNKTLGKESDDAAFFLASQIFRIFVSAQYLLCFPFYLRFPIFPPSRFLVKGPLLSSSSFAILIIFPHFSPERSDFSQSLLPLPPLRPSAHIYRISTQSNSLFPPFLRGRLRIRQILSKSRLSHPNPPFASLVNPAPPPPIYASSSIFLLLPLLPREPEKTGSSSSSSPIFS